MSWRHKATDLREEVQRAKETLSEVTVCQLWVPGIERDVQLTRGELEKLIESDIEATVDCLERALDDANVKAKDLAGIYLVGGSSRIPLVGSSIYRRLQVMPSVQDNPKSVVALGAAAWDMALRTLPRPALLLRRPGPESSPQASGGVTQTQTFAPGPPPTVAQPGQPVGIPAQPLQTTPASGSPHPPAPGAPTPGTSQFRSAIVMAVGIDAVA